MTCQHCQQHLPGHVFDALPDDESTAMHLHLERCADCQAQLQAVRARLGLLQEWDPGAPSSDLGARTIARLAAEPTRPWWARLASALDDSLRSFGAHRPTRLSGLATTAVVLLLLVPVLSPNWTRHRSSGAVSGCRVNLRLLGKALDRYAADHQGRFPAALADLKPAYVRLFPECPQAGVDTYGPGYTVGPEGLHYHLACHGDHHRDEGLPDNEPRIRR